MSLEKFEKQKRENLKKQSDRLGDADSVPELCRLLTGYASWHGNPAQDLKRALDCYLSQEPEIK
jgi:hypothetical protein